METVKEGSYFYLDVSFTDEDGGDKAPTWARYRIDCISTVAEILAWTTVDSGDLAATIALFIKDSYSTILNQSNKKEHKILTIEARYDDDAEKEIREEYIWRVLNLQKIP